MAMNGVGCQATARIMGVSLARFYVRQKLRPQSVTSRIQPGTSSSAPEMDSGAMSGPSAALAVLRV
ncbi:hypothetical protein C5N10_0023385 [Escherichia coli]|nr:hypothetical protein [Escherichia coli]